jgi:hypothetical protein
MATGLKRDIQRSAASAIAGFLERIDFGVSSTESLVKTAADNLISVGNDGTHERIRLDEPAAPLRECERFPHAAFIE